MDTASCFNNSIDYLVLPFPGFVHTQLVFLVHLLYSWHLALLAACELRRLRLAFVHVTFYKQCISFGN